jgi:UDP-N-acetylmuramoyl-L-alanyl-D-glutamate--2,6-diaminopimelate ligase
MAGIAGRGADIVVVTSDNPRHEDPDAIIRDIMPGLQDTPARVLVEVDRRTATRLALAEARPGDLVLLAGKGDETCTIVGDERIPYDDRLVAREILAEMP